MTAGLAIPVNKPVLLTLHSKDMGHSFDVRDCTSGKACTLDHDSHSLHSAEDGQVEKYPTLLSLSPALIPT